MKNNEFDFINIFPSLGHPEHHFNKYPDHRWLKNEKDIRGWCLDNIEIGNFFGLTRKITNEDFFINNSLCVELKKTALKDLERLGIYLMIKNNLYGVLPVQFLEVKRFAAINIGLKSLIGSPYNGDSFTFDNNEIESFIGLSGNIKKGGKLSKNKISSFINMPNFNSDDLRIFIDKNPISSWDGFTKCKVLSWWQDEWCEKNSLNLLMETPDNIDKIYLLNQFNSNQIVKSEKNNLWLDMEWLRNEQKKIKKIKNMKSRIDNSLELKRYENKKRKL